MSKTILSMGTLIELTVQLIRAGKRAYERKWTFLWVFIVAFVGTVVVLGTLDLLPEMPPASTVATVVRATDAHPATSTTAVVMTELPIKIEIPAINLSVSIANPLTTSVKVLDEELLKGAVRYPTSAKLGETGNVVLFGHSSYLPVVGNQAYKTFNGIQKLSSGDLVTVYSAGTAYTYRVTRMTKESANDTAIPLDVTGRVLTLATCDSFGAKSDRFVVTADFVESHLISG